VGERLSMTAGRLLLIPLLLEGVASVLWWRHTGDVRLYGVVQYVPMLAFPLVLLFRTPRYSRGSYLWGMFGLYAVAKALELADRPIGQIISTGGHPWKHLAAAGAMLCYCASVAGRTILVKAPPVPFD
jgi:hypothetical protein